MSHILLAIYLLVVMHSCIAHTSVNTLWPSPASKHQHEGYKDVHHDRHFHVGIFHLIGHFLEKLNNADNHADSHLVIIYQSVDKQITIHKNPVSVYISGLERVHVEVDVEIFTIPPWPLIRLQKIVRVNTPLRAPPSYV